MLAEPEALGHNVSDLHRAGAYVLLLRGLPQFVGRGRKLLPRLYAHSIQRRGEYLAGCPRVPVQYDEVIIYPCSPGDLDSEFARVCAHWSWQCPNPS